MQIHGWWVNNYLLIPSCYQAVSWQKPAAGQSTKKRILTQIPVWKLAPTKWRLGTSSTKTNQIFDFLNKLHIILRIHPINMPCKNSISVQFLLNYENAYWKIFDRLCTVLIFTSQAMCYLLHPQKISHKIKRLPKQGKRRVKVMFYPSFWRRIGLFPMAEKRDVDVWSFDHRIPRRLNLLIESPES